MIFQLLQSGAMSLIDGNNTVYQGSNNATTLFVIANVAPPTGLQIAFTYPDGTVSDTAVPMYLEGDGAIEGTSGYVWSYKLPYRVTEVEGTVGVSINVVNSRTTYINNQTTYTATIEVVYSALPAPQAEYSQTDWQQVLDLLTNYYSWVQTMGDRTELTTEDKTTLVAAINEVNAKVMSAAADIEQLQTDVATAQTAAETAQTAAETAQALAESAEATGNTAVEKATSAEGAAQTAGQTATQALNTANGIAGTANSALANAAEALEMANAADGAAAVAKAIAEGREYAVGRENYPAMITELNAADKAMFKVGDNIFIRQIGVPDLWVSSVEEESAAYNYTTDDAFVDELKEIGYVQVGFWKLAALETTGEASSIAWQNVSVPLADFVEWTPTADLEEYLYRAAIDLTDFVDYSTVTFVTFNAKQASSGNFAPYSDSYVGGVYIYAKELPETAVVIPSLITFKSNIAGGSVGGGGGWNTRGAWVLGGSYSVADAVYDAAGCYLCVQTVVSTLAPENDSEHWSPVYVTPQPTTNPVLMVTNNEMLTALTDGGFADLQIVTPEDDDGYALGRLYQFHIINDVYSWEEVTPVTPAQVQSNWDETDAESPAFILNKPTKGIPVVEVATSGSVTQILDPNKFYNFTGTFTDLTLTLGAAESGIVNEYMGQFTTGSTVPTVTWPTGVTWVGGTPSIVASTTYQFSIVNNVGVAVSV